jgi:hypothetical protein
LGGEQDRQASGASEEQGGRQLSHHVHSLRIADFTQGFLPAPSSACGEAQLESFAEDRVCAADKLSVDRDNNPEKMGDAIHERTNI